MGDVFERRVSDEGERELAPANLRPVPYEFLLRHKQVGRRFLATVRAGRFAFSISAEMSTP